MRPSKNTLQNKHINNLTRLYFKFEVIFLPRKAISKKSPQKMLRVEGPARGLSGMGPPAPPSNPPRPPLLNLRGRFGFEMG